MLDVRRRDSEARVLRRRLRLWYSRDEEGGSSGTWLSEEAKGWLVIVRGERKVALFDSRVSRPTPNFHGSKVAAWKDRAPQFEKS